MPRNPTKKNAAKKKPAKKSAKVAKQAATKRGGASTKQSPDWRSKLLAQIRRLIEQADPEVVEEVKWRKPSNPAGVPVWSHAGIICTGDTYKDKVKVTFAKGASLDDPAGLFNASLDGNTRRAIDFFEGDEIDGKAFMALVRAAVALNTS